jgi:hypothetical protein
MDQQALSKAMQDLCGDDVLLSNRATRELESIFTPDAVLADNAEVMRFTQMALDANAHPSARRFAVHRLAAAAKANPSRFLSSSQAVLCAKIVAESEESIGIADAAATALMYAAASDDNALAPLQELVPELTSPEALLRLAGAGLTMTGEVPTARPALAGGYVASTLGQHMSRAIEEDDTLLLVNLIATTLASARYCGAQRYLGDTVVKFVSQLAADGTDQIVLPYVLRGIGSCIARGPSNNVANTDTFGPALATLAAKGTTVELTSWAVAMSALLSTPAGVHHVSDPTTRRKVADVTERALRFGAHDLREAASHILDAAAACRPTSASALPWLLSEVTASTLLTTTVSTDENVRIAGWKAIASILAAVRDAQLASDGSFLTPLAPAVPMPFLSPVCLRLINVIESTQSVYSTPDHLALQEAIRKAGRALLALEDTAKECVHDDAWIKTVRLLESRGVSRTEMAL